MQNIYNLTSLMDYRHPRFSEFADRLWGPEGCHYRETEKGQRWTCAGGENKDKTIAILRDMGLDEDAIADSCELFQLHGGYCDCEILSNYVSDVEEQHFAWRYKQAESSLLEFYARNQKPLPVDPLELLVGLASWQIHQRAVQEVSIDVLTLAGEVRDICDLSRRKAVAPCPLWPVTANDMISAYGNIDRRWARSRAEYHDSTPTKKVTEAIARVLKRSPSFVQEGEI